MANLLVYVATNHLDDLLGAGAREQGRRIPIERAKLPPQVERLDAGSTLFFVTVDGVRARIVASLEDPQPGPVLGIATIHDHDITNLLGRLGCTKVWQVPVWAATPRIVPPEDAEYLRYHLGLPLDVEMPTNAPNAPIPAGDPLAAITRRVAELEARVASFQTADTQPMLAVRNFDSVADALRAAVFANPASDTARREYAAHLEELGDPRGELIAMQLGRVERGETISERERALIARVGDACAEPLRPYLAEYELRCGFVWRAVMAREAVVPATIRLDPAWATVVDLATTDAELLATARLTSLRRARIEAHTIEQLGAGTRPFSVGSLLPYPEPRPHLSRGIALSAPALDTARVVAHAMCVNAIGFDAKEVLSSPLVQRLSHLDAWVDAVTAAMWRAAFDASELPLLTLRFAAHGIEPLVAFARRDGTHRMLVELRATVSTEIARDLAALIASLGTGIAELELVDTSLAPFPAQQPDLVRALAPAFKTITLRRGVTLALV